MYIYTSIRIAGTIRGFRTFKFAQKDGLLAAFFELFLCQKCTKRIKKYTNFSKNHLNCVAYFVLFFSKKSFCKSNFIPFEVIFNSTWTYFWLIRTSFLVRQDETKVASGRTGETFREKRTKKTSSAGTLEAFGHVKMLYMAGY